ncbi:hypothetical protein CY34DRAFT_22661 [Suillus luteus UH-Slu-Lm8-n1]|uniref:DDE Tnp4 domain-containing protein n=1 Tax=Suillus luteus UH-Slu-Lm8-n1 TaxID=930992 RepID=A0A0D0ATZ5_9AGAM|nr:hypothetical protein CY34DRAFT_22661 [Suillus luteus UH-Slu-Lm8-n1]
MEFPSSFCQTKQQINNDFVFNTSDNLVTESTLSKSSESPTTTSTTDFTSQVSESDESSNADSEFSEDSSVLSFDSEEETDGEPLPHILTVTKIKYPDHFRQILRVTPYTFNQITAKICTDPIFANHSHCKQYPVDVQLAITLYRFGHSGNAAGQSAVTHWAGVGHGTVSLMTRRVMTAILQPDFMANAVHFPTAEEKEAAKFWVVSLPNLRIVDFSDGHTGSTHNSSAWDGTQLKRDHNKYMEGDEFVWADSAYPPY